MCGGVCCGECARNIRRNNAFFVVSSCSYIYIYTRNCRLSQGCWIRVPLHAADIAAVKRWYLASSSYHTEKGGTSAEGLDPIAVLYVRYSCRAKAAYYAVC